MQMLLRKFYQNMKWNIIKEEVLMIMLVVRRTLMNTLAIYSMKCRQ